MTAGSYSFANLIIRKLECIFALTEDEKQTLRDLAVKVSGLSADQNAVCVGERPSQSCLVMEGIPCLYKLTREGKRQIMALHVPGDMPDLQSLHLKVMAISIASISPGSVGLIPHKDLHRRCKRYPRITDALWREPLTDASIFREWLLNIGTSSVHVSRILKRLRDDGLTQTQGGQVTVPDWDKLTEAGDFDPLYLHLEDLGDA